MQVWRIPAALFGTNCYVVAAAAREECVVVDPGAGIEAQLGELLAEHGLRPAAVVLTHGHIDHLFTVTPVCQAHGVPVVVHEDDRYRVADPVSGLDPGLRFMLQQQFGPMTTWTEPSEVRTVGARPHERLQVAGLDLLLTHAPGHTQGSVLVGLEGVPEGHPEAEGTGATVLSGDVLFAGSIGRCDLPGGDLEAMGRTLVDRVLTLPDDTYVLPGHGPATTIGAERATNPYLRQARHPGARR